jgi:hypothetical protein
MNIICPKGILNPHPFDAINTKNGLACSDYGAYDNKKEINHNNNKKANHSNINASNISISSSIGSNDSNKKETTNRSNLRSQLFNLNNLSMNELKSKWIELYKSNPNNFQRGYLVKGLAYKIQSLYGLSNTSEDEVKVSLRIAKQKLKTNNTANNISYCDELNYNAINNDKNETKIKKQVFLPPVGSVISTYHNNIKYMVKVLEDNKFSYNNKIYKSLSAIANEITGTRWSGYAFFHLK